jgi:hypothetical protein
MIRGVCMSRFSPMSREAAASSLLRRRDEHLFRFDVMDGL